MAINWWMDKQDVTDPYNRLSIKHRKEWGTDSWDLNYEYYVKWNKPVTKGHRLHNFIYTNCPEWADSETESRSWLPTVWGEEIMGSVFMIMNMGFRYQVIKMFQN